MNFNSVETCPFNLNLAMEHTGPIQMLSNLFSYNGYPFTLVKYITDSTISQALKNSRDGKNYAREYPALIQNILIQGFLVTCFPFLSSFIYVGCVSLLFNPFFLMFQNTRS